MSVTYPIKLILAFRSGDRCAFPGCPKNLTLDAPAGDGTLVTGEAAHMAGEQPNSARYDSSMTDEQRNSYPNLIYLCQEHHTLIDDVKQRFNYPVTDLINMKAEHEKKVCDAIDNAFAGVGFKELAQAVEWITKISPGEQSQDYTIVPPDEKIKKNELSDKSRHIITMGLGVTKQVKDFVESEAQMDVDFPERLKCGFLEKYCGFRKEGHRGDDLFDLMCAFAQRGFSDAIKRSAGLAVLIYLFEACEVFEK